MKVIGLALLSIGCAPEISAIPDLALEDIPSLEDIPFEPTEISLRAPSPACLAGHTAQINGVGYNSINAAVNDAMAGDIVYVCPGDHNETVVVNHDRAITITSDNGSAASTTLSGPGIVGDAVYLGPYYGGAWYDSGTGLELQHKRILEVDNDNADVTVSRLTLQDGVSLYDAGGIKVHKAERFVLEGCRIGSNFATYTGGGMEISNTNVVEIIDTQFADNASGYEGGAITMDAPDDGVVIVTGSRFINNDADYSGGALNFSVDRAHTTFDMVDFRANYSGYEGGAISINAEDGVVDFNMVRLMQNKTDYVAGAVLFNKRAEVTIIDSQTRANVSDYESAGWHFGNADGGIAKIHMEGGLVWQNTDGYGAVSFSDDWEVTVDNVHFGTGWRDNSPYDVENCTSNFGANASFVYNGSTGIYCQ